MVASAKFDPGMPVAWSEDRPQMRHWDTIRSRMGSVACTNLFPSGLDERNVQPQAGFSRRCPVALSLQLRATEAQAVHLVSQKKGTPGVLQGLLSA
jgi:hypothetical protein